MLEFGKVKSVAFRSIGCRTNQEELAVLKCQFMELGYKIADECGDADIVIVNTCAVTALTEVKTRKIIKTIRAQAPCAKILVTGCMVQNKPGQFENFAGINWVVGNTLKNKIPSIVQNSPEGVYHCSFDEMREKSNSVQMPAKKIYFGGKTRFPVKIQEGCDFGCAYCIVPSVRGPSRSYDLEQVLGACSDAIDVGYKEIVLTGTHIGQFRHGLVNLINKILMKKGDFRIRLSSLDPRDLNRELLDSLGDERVCKHLHLSLQSLSEPVLEGMNRPYSSVSKLLELLNEFREKYPHAGFGADLIVGFPGETDEMFETTLKRADELRLSYAHVFRFSPREGTRAVELPNQVDEKTKLMRSAMLREVIEKNRALFIKNMHNIRERIIVESENPCRGLTSNYLHVEIPEHCEQKNSWLEITVLPQTRGRFVEARVASEL